MRWIPRLRMLVARRPWLYWLMVAGCATAIGVVVTGAIDDVRRERDSWGTTTRVLVATRDVSVGDALGPAVEGRDVPLAVAPSTALAALPPGATARQDVSAGEMIVDRDVSAEQGPLSILPNGWLAIDVPRVDQGLDGARSLFTIGDAAMVMADGSVIAEDAIIVGVSADGLAVGVPTEVGARVALAASQRAAVVALKRA